jgi:hypothetical protein
VGPPPIAPAAPPSQRWFLGFAPDAATYGILYFLGEMRDEHFHLESATGPAKLDLGNTLYAPLAWYDEKVGGVGLPLVLLLMLTIAVHAWIGSVHPLQLTSELCRFAQGCS